MKILTLTTAAILLVGFSANAQSKSKDDVCETAAYDYAVKQQHKDYPGKQFEKEEVQDPDVQFSEQKKNSFETWTIEYSINEECLEGYELLVRRSADGKSCAAIKATSDNGRDCG